VKLHRFPKSERLRSKKLIDILFNPAYSAKLGGNVFLYPFKIVWIKSIDNQQLSDATQIQEPLYPQLLISVPKRNFKRATDRNRIRRQIKEAYRLNKVTLFKNKPFSATLGIMYIAKEKNEFPFLQKKLIAALKKML
jgi:ribonuclease P protein component